MPVSRLRLVTIALLSLAPALTLRLGTHPAAAAAVMTLVATAEHNTNTVRTLVHQDVITTNAKSLKVTMVGHGQEDEVHNREEDTETVTVSGRASNGKTKTLHYGIDVIFLNGKTYYRASFNQNKWKSAKGMTFNDPYTGGWQRGRTTISFPKNTVFTQVGTTGSEVHVRAPITGSNYVGTADLWISTGSTPYVVRQDVREHTTKGAAVTRRIQMRLGPFNSTLAILAPSASGTT